MPIDFVWNEENGSYDLERYATTDKELIKHIQNGKTERALYRVENDVLILDRIFGTIAPENFYQNTIDGQNNILSAKAAMSALYVNSQGGEWPLELLDLAEQFNQNSKHVNIGVYTPKAWKPYFNEFKDHD